MTAQSCMNLFLFSEQQQHCVWCVWEDCEVLGNTTNFVVHLWFNHSTYCSICGSHWVAVWRRKGQTDVTDFNQVQRESVICGFYHSPTVGLCHSFLYIDFCGHCHNIKTDHCIIIDPFFKWVKSVFKAELHIDPLSPSHLCWRTHADKNWQQTHVILLHRACICRVL